MDMDIPKGGKKKKITFVNFMTIIKKVDVEEVKVMDIVYNF